MNKRGDTDRLLFEIAYISFAVFIGLAVLYFVNTSTKDTSFQAQIYAKDISKTIEVMQNLQANKLRVKYELPEEYTFNLGESYVYVTPKDQEKPQKEAYSKKENLIIKFERQGEFIILEKNENI